MPDFAPPQKKTETANSERSKNGLVQKSRTSDVLSVGNGALMETSSLLSESGSLLSERGSQLLSRSGGTPMAGTPP
ncbi:hypothetical protein, partial [Enterovibrio norvegicus]